MEKKYSAQYYMSLLIQIVNRECNEALEEPLTSSQRDNVRNMLAEASKAERALGEMREEQRNSW
jgi:hypothetical protein